MLLTHALVLQTARSSLAALADTAVDPVVARAYDAVLLRLDELHHGDVPAITDAGTRERTALLDAAGRSLRDLVTFGIEPLAVELTVAQLEAAWVLESQ